jgi:hypothetical protein
MIPESPPDSRRVSFFDEQATHRARARRWGAVSALIILGLGGVYGFLMLGVISFYALLLVELLPAWLTAPLAATGLKDNLPPAWFLFTAGVMLAAGVAAAVRRVLGTASLGAIESNVGLRPVNPADLEERQLANIVSEMAIAGGVPEPRVLLMEGDVVNAGLPERDRAQFLSLGVCSISWTAMRHRGYSASFSPRSQMAICALHRASSLFCRPLASS